MNIERCTHRGEVATRARAERRSVGAQQCGRYATICLAAAMSSSMRGRGAYCSRSASSASTSPSSSAARIQLSRASRPTHSLLRRHRSIGDREVTPWLSGKVHSNSTVHAAALRRSVAKRGHLEMNLVLHSPTELLCPTLATLLRNSRPTQARALGATCPYFGAVYHN